MDINANFLLKLKLIFSKPDELFNILKKEKGIANAVITLLFASIIISGIKFIFSTFLFSFLSPKFNLGPFFSFYGGIGLLFSVFGFLIVSFIYSFLIFIFLMMFKVNAKYSETYKAFTYSIIPSVIFSIIPFIGFLAIIYSIYLAIVGVAILNYIPKRKAILPVLLPLVVLIIIGIIIILYLISQFLQGGGSIF